MRRDERGIALLTVLFASLLLTVIGLGMMYSTNMETSINHNYRESQVALYAALAGLQEARQRIKFPYEITPPELLPSTTAANIVYIVSNASTVKPWDPANAYFDTELCQEHVLGLTGTPGVPCTATASGTAWYQYVDDSLSSSAPWNFSNPLEWKWTRIQLKGNNNTPVPVNGNATNSSQACWNGTSQMSTPTSYTTGCQPLGGVNAVTVVSPGTGYTSTPSVTLTGGGGTGATANVYTVAETTGYVTGIAVNNGGSYASPPTVTLSGNATAVAVLSSTGSTVVTGGTVTSATVTSAGSGYTSSPAVTISGGGGSGALGTANLSAGASVITGGSVTSANVTAGGTGYSSAPAVTFAGGGGSGASGTAVMVPDGTGGVITGGTVTATTLTAGGSGYTSPPTVTFSGPGTGASATAVLSSTGTTVTTGSVSSLTLSSGGSNYTTAPTVTLNGGGGSGATATAALATSGTVASVSLGSAGTQCYSSASDAVITFSGGGGGSGAAASAVLGATRSCIYSVAVTSSPQCTNKLDAAHGYSPIDQKSGVTFVAGNGSFSGTLFVRPADDKSPNGLSVQNPGYDTSGYSAATFTSQLKLSAGAFPDCNNITATATTGYRIASINVTSGGSGYTSTPTVIITGGVGTTSNPTATATRGFPVTGLTLTSGGTSYSSAPTVSISGGGGSGAAGTAAVVSSSTTTYPVAAINLVSGGSGYISTPTITLSGGGGNGAAGTATVVTTGTTTYSVLSITITGGGINYTSAPTVSFSGGGSGSGAAATALVTTTTSTTYSVASITITSGGTGYTSTPAITLSGGSGTGATATANVTFATATTYPVASINVTSGGTGYTSVPTVTLTGGGGSGGGLATASIGTMNTGTYAIDHIDVTSAGSGYTTNPTVVLSGGGGSGAAASSQISGGTKYGKVWLLTSLAQTRNGARSIVQMEVSSPVLGFAPGGPLTLDGPNPVIDAMPNSVNFYIRGNDANSCHDPVAEPDEPAIDGFDDPNASPPTASVETIIDSLPRPDHYLGAGGTPSVQNGFGAMGETMTTPAGMDSVMSAIYNTPGAHHYTSANVGSFNPTSTTLSSINYVDGNLTLNGNGTGHGVLVVTGTLTMSGNFSWYGIIFVVGDGHVQMNGGGNGEVHGSIWVAKTWDASHNLLASLGSPAFAWNGGGINSMQYDHCLVSNLLTAVDTTHLTSTRPLKILSYRALPY